MGLNTVQEIERAIDALTPQQLEELYWGLDRNHPQAIDARLPSDLAACSSRTKPFIALWTTKKTAAFSRSKRGCIIALRRISGRNTARFPQDIRARADKQFLLLQDNPQHPSLQFKKNPANATARKIWSARVSLNYRALAIKRADGYLWFWIGDHKTYDTLIS